MNLRKQLFTQSDCYKANRQITVKGIMVHDTAAGNPSLKRYVGPDDGQLGKNQYSNDWNRPGINKCVHAFIGKLANGNIATYQTLPWNWRGWHAGGAANDTHIGFEICDDGYTNAAYFAAVYMEAVELCAYLCKEYHLNPTANGVIIGHYEGYQRGIASNHGDPKGWFAKFGKSMDTFRSDVSKQMNSGPVSPPPAPGPTPPPTTGEYPATLTSSLKNGQKVRYSGRLFADSFGGGAGKTVSGTFELTRDQINNRSHGLGITGGWIPVAGTMVVGVSPGTPVPTPPTPPAATRFKKDDRVKIRAGAKWYSGSSIPAWVMSDVWLVKADQPANSNRVVLGKNVSGKTDVNSPIRAEDLISI